ncbi:hypothetical protein BFF78_00760 [Streptomyces fodineus]|uniref:Cytochrome P450 n=2 Tax=Streptomyces fodineus TaxID=1904616 RepID=A0A1D7Y2J7_9ACTN|nr:hypothetical protein BFF78_00760 [Streptomyces fodineus]
MPHGSPHSAGDATAGTASAEAARCPVDHSAQRAQTVIPETALTGPKIPVPLQLAILRKRPTKFADWCRNRYGSRYKVSIMPNSRLYMLSDPDEVRAMFMAPRDVIHTGNSNHAIEKFTGQSGLAWLDEDEHKVRRKQLMPSFKGTSLKRIEASINARIQRDIAAWPREQALWVHPRAHIFTMEVIREVIFGKMVPSRWPELFEVLMKMMRVNRRPAGIIMPHRMRPAVVRALAAIPPVGLGHFIEHRKRADALIAEAVKERMDAGELGDDMLSLLLGITHEDGSLLSASEMRDEMMTIFLAGTETVAASVSWALEFLSLEHEVRSRLIAEIEEGTSDTYLTAVIYEVLRMRPPLTHIITREVVKPIEIGGVRYEPGARLWANAYLVNHDPSRYPEPHLFRPERFLGVNPGNHTWIPFGGGATRCLGDRIAMVELKAVIREVLMTCELQRVNPRPAELHGRGIVLVPDTGARLVLRPRVRKPEPVNSDEQQAACPTR